MTPIGISERRLKARRVTEHGGQAFFHTKQTCAQVIVGNYASHLIRPRSAYRQIADGYRQLRRPVGIRIFEIPAELGKQRTLKTSLQYSRRAAHGELLQLHIDEEARQLAQPGRYRHTCY